MYLLIPYLLCSWIGICVHICSYSGALLFASYGGLMYAIVRSVPQLQHSQMITVNYADCHSVTKHCLNASVTTVFSPAVCPVQWLMPMGLLCTSCSECSDCVLRAVQISTVNTVEQFRVFSLILPAVFERVRCVVAVRNRLHVPVAPGPHLRGGGKRGSCLRVHSPLGHARQQQRRRPPSRMLEGSVRLSPLHPRWPWSWCAYFPWNS